VILRSIPVFLSALLLAAHFLRWGNLPLVVLCLLFPFLLFVHRRWALRTVQALTLAGAVIWASATYRFVRQRMLLGEPWGRLVVILGLLILLSCVAALLLNSKTVRHRYPKPAQHR
jgi:hypothetical protein